MVDAGGSHRYADGATSLLSPFLSHYGSFKNTHRAQNYIISGVCLGRIFILLELFEMRVLHIFNTNFTKASKQLMYCSSIIQSWENW